MADAPVPSAPAAAAPPPINDVKPAPPEAPAPAETKADTPAGKAAQPAKATLPKPAKNGNTAAIVATVIIVIALGLMATLAYLTQK